MKAAAPSWKNARPRSVGAEPMAGLHPVLMPKLGLTMTEATLVEWLVAPGARFARGDVLFVAETDKIASDIAAESDGRLAEIVVPSGATVAVGTVVAMIEHDAAAAVALSEVVSAPLAARAMPAEAARGSAGDRVVATPLARRMARDSGVDLAGLSGTGPRGRIKAQDVQRAAAMPSAPCTAAPTGPAPALPVGPEAERVVLSRPQIVAAGRTSRSKNTVPHFYLTATVAVDALDALRSQVNASGGWPRTTVSHWLVAAIGRALVDLPAARRVWRSDGAVQLSGSAVGVVADIEGELFIPVVADAGTCSVGVIAARLSGLVARAGAGTLRHEDMAGAAVSLSNLGMHGVDSVIPVIDPDQGMIVGAGKVGRVFRPDATGAPVAVSETVLTLACDHRIHNGVSASRFLGRVVTYLQEPMRLLMSPVADQGA